MKKLINIFSIAVIAIAISGTVSSCKKDDKKDAAIPPVINFVSGAAYITADATVKKDTTVVVGLGMGKPEGDDILISYNVVRKYDAGADSTVLAHMMTSAESDTLFAPYIIHCRNVAGTEKYTFNVVDKDGVTNTKSLTLTVQ
jgi:hypothetical protein